VTRLPCLLTLIAAGSIAFASLVLKGSSSGAVAARTGGFGEMTCQQCHWDNQLNEPPGLLRLTGVPKTYTPRQRYLITVTLARPGLTRGGFQVAAREDSTKPNVNRDAGSLRSIGGLTELIRDDTTQVTYLQHTKVGTGARISGEAEWRFEWTAPDSGPVVFHVAANAANGDDSALEDFIYTAEARTSYGAR
jgi:hypothetical protein